MVPDTGELISTSVRSSATAADFRFTDLEDSVTSYGVGVTLPIQLGNFRFQPGGGCDYTEKGRSYLQTQLGLGTTGAPTSVLVGTPGQVFTDENVLDPSNDFVLSLGGIGTESYLAGETVDAVWGNLDETWNEIWRLAAVKLRLQNLLDEQLEIEQGGVTVLEQTVGTVIKLDLSYRF